MTMFSYIISRKQREQFREPVLLSILIKRLISDKKYPKLNAHGWLVHYTVGTTFCTLYDYVWRRSNLNPTLANGAIIGALTGVVGITGWHLTFQLHPDPPKINLQKYYGHLLVAHVVFGMFAALGYRLPEMTKLNGKGRILDVVAKGGSMNERLQVIEQPEVISI